MYTKAAVMPYIRHLPASAGTRRPSQGSFFSWLPVPKGHSSQSLADLLLQEAKVVVAPGVGFGTHGEGYVRLGLLSSEERLEEAVQRIGKLNLFVNS